MGQYYKPVFLKRKTNSATPDDVLGWFYSHNHRERVIREDGSSFISGCGLKLMEHSWIENRFVQNVERNLIDSPKHLVWAGDYAENEVDVKYFDEEEKEEVEYNLYQICDEDKEIKAKVAKLGKKHRYLVNHTKQQYVDKQAVPKNDGWEVHPLPLLTAEGNGQGGGDYRGKETHIGVWARDLISVESKKPDGFTELKPNFVE